MRRYYTISEFFFTIEDVFFKPFSLRFRRVWHWLNMQARLFCISLKCNRVQVSVSFILLSTVETADTTSIEWFLIVARFFFKLFSWESIRSSVSCSFASKWLILIFLSITISQSYLFPFFLTESTIKILLLKKTENRLCCHKSKDEADQRRPSQTYWR